MARTNRANGATRANGANGANGANNAVLEVDQVQTFIASLPIELQKAMKRASLNCKTTSTAVEQLKSATKCVELKTRITNDSTVYKNMLSDLLRAPELSVAVEKSNFKKHVPISRNEHSGYFQARQNMFTLLLPLVRANKSACDAILKALTPTPTVK